MLLVRFDPFFVTVITAVVYDQSNCPVILSLSVCLTIKHFQLQAKFMLLLMRNIYVSYVPLFVISSLKIDIKGFLSHSLQQIYFVLEKGLFFWNAFFLIYMVYSTYLIFF